jgi:hypothetical protein
MADQFLATAVRDRQELLEKLARADQVIGDLQADKRAYEELEQRRASEKSEVTKHSVTLKQRVDMLEADKENLQRELRHEADQRSAKELEKSTMLKQAEAVFLKQSADVTTFEIQLRHVQASERKLQVDLRQEKIAHAALERELEVSITHNQADAQKNDKEVSTMKRDSYNLKSSLTVTEAARDQALVEVDKLTKREAALMAKVKCLSEELAVIHERTIPAEIGLQHWKRKAEHLEKSMTEWSESRQADVSRLQAQASEAENARHQALMDLHTSRSLVKELREELEAQQFGDNRIHEITLPLMDTSTTVTATAGTPAAGNDKTAVDGGESAVNVSTEAETVAHVQAQMRQHWARMRQSWVVETKKAVERAERKVRTEMEQAVEGERISNQIVLEKAKMEHIVALAQAKSQLEQATGQAMDRLEVAEVEAESLVEERQHRAQLEHSLAVAEAGKAAAVRQSREQLQIALTEARAAYEKSLVEMEFQAQLDLDQSVATGRDRLVLYTHCSLTA